MPGTTSNGNAVGRQHLQFLAAAAEDEGVAALEPHHLPARARQLHEQGVDVVLRHAVVVALLADIDALGIVADSASTSGPTRWS